jgi:hypothetical protein
MGCRVDSGFEPQAVSSMKKMKSVMMRMPQRREVWRMKLIPPLKI